MHSDLSETEKGVGVIVISKTDKKIPQINNNYYTSMKISTILSE